MYRNATELAPGTIVKDFDICIAGAGAAGIIMAYRLIDSSKKVLLLANGSFDDTGATPGEALQSIYRGTLGPFLSGVDPIFLTRSRLNMYGGTTNHFQYNARPLDEADLAPRPGYRTAGWPLTMEALNEYYQAANLLGNFGSFNYSDLAFWAGKLGSQPFPVLAGDSMQSVVFHANQDKAYFPFQTHFNDALNAASNVTVLFNAQVLTIATTPGQASVTELCCAAIEDGKQGRSFQVQAGAFVLALGGIEPVRLLKLSGNLGDNCKGHLGRGFMLHPGLGNAATVTFSDPSPYAPFYSGKTVTLDGPLAFEAWGSLAPTPEAMVREEIGAFHANLFFNGPSARISINLESVPNEESTITLDPVQLDPVFGQPALHLDWQLLPQDKRTAIRGLELVKDYLLAQHGVSDFQINVDLSGGPEQWPLKRDVGEDKGLDTGDHHMGALRMSAAPDEGIVDPDCKVHTVNNLYIAGSGVFPTTGHANPTLTIVALALRLADHLR